MRIGGLAPVYIAEEIAGNSSTIAGGKPGMTLSWQVTRVRKDPWAEANPLTEADLAQEQEWLASIGIALARAPVAP